MRGRHIRRHTSSTGDRFIPARAGEADGAQVTADRQRVHPRSCGGGAPKSMIRPSEDGSSPLVRGRRLLLQPHPVPLRFIPARAGEAKNSRYVEDMYAVHPRSCGGGFSASAMASA